MEVNNKHLLRQLLFYFLLLATALNPIQIFGQQQSTIRGTVVDVSGLPIIGANILVKGTTNGSVTDMDGNYTITNVTSPATLLITYIGYINQEIIYNGQSRIDITLIEDIQSLNEVVVVGYGSLSRRELSSSIVQVDKSNFQ